jgi:hypothetical protein
VFRASNGPVAEVVNFAGQADHVQSSDTPVTF